MMGRVGPSLEDGAAVGMGVELMRASIDEDIRISLMRFGGAIVRQRVFVELCCDHRRTATYWITGEVGYGLKHLRVAK